MLNKFKAFLFITILYLFFSIIKCDLRCDDVQPNELILNTLNGKVKGSCEYVYIYNANNTDTDEVSVMNWFGIPYAEPPVKNLRFSKPSPVKSWSDVKKGTEMSNQCIQSDGGSEDCLYLNIFSPYESYVNSVIQKKPSSLMPIFVFIHGGSYISGSGEYRASMISAVSNVIAITINYRLGGLGLIQLTGTNATGNQFLFDQQLALKWIYENADRFGGDRNRITICGLSAGSTSVGYHLLIKSSWPYFRNAILQSGNPATDFSDHYTPANSDAVTKEIASTAGCNVKLTNQEILNCLQSIDAKRLNEITIDTVVFPVVVLNKDLFDEQPMNLFQKGNFKKNGNILNGYTNFEQLSLAYDELDSSEINKLKNGDFETFKSVIQNRLSLDDDQLESVLKFYLNQSDLNNKNVDYFYHYVVIVSDYEYKCPTHVFSELVSAYNPNVYTYLFAHRKSDSDYPSKFNGAAHADDLDFTFGFPLYEKDYYKPDEMYFTEQIVNYWGNFIRYDKPSLKGEWPRYAETKSNENRNLFYLKMNQIKNTIYKTGDATCKFWTDIGVFDESHD